MAIKLHKFLIPLFLTTLPIAPQAHAEYYLSHEYSCDGCVHVRPTYIATRPCHVAHHYTESCEHVVHHRTDPCAHHRRRSSYHISVYNCGCAAPTYDPCPCGGGAVYGYRRIVDFSSQPYAYYGRYYDETAYFSDHYATYDPDLATGDDDQFASPDLDIDE